MDNEKKFSKYSKYIHKIQYGGSYFTILTDHYKKIKKYNHIDKVEIIDIFNIINNKSADVQFSGVHYLSDYLNNVPDIKFEDINRIKYVTNNIYWNIFYGQIYITTSKNSNNIFESLDAWITGPTIADCGSALHVCIYIHLLNRYGFDVVQKRFNYPLCKLIIPGILFSDFKTHSKSHNYETGNPLFSLFDVIDNPTLDKLRHNDFVYIEGVDIYTLKHPIGEWQGNY